jgi:hypothetical protein
MIGFSPARLIGGCLLSELGWDWKLSFIVLLPVQTGARCSHRNREALSRET